ncbi:MAG: calcium-binding protein [Paracoccaceae bacterium]
MELLFLLGIFGVGMGALLFQDSEEPEQEQEPDTEEDAITLEIDASGDYEGSAGADSISIATGLDFLDGLTLDSGAGDDSLAFAEAGTDGPVDPDSTYLVNSEVDAGAGNDTIIAIGDSSVISGNDGDDMLTVAGSVTILGGAGDDQIISDGLAGAVSIEGGEGDDVIDATRVTLGTVDGGAGDDSISLSSYNSAGQFVAAYGGEGDDTLEIDVRTPSDFSDFDFSLWGGEGADTFLVRIGEGFAPEGGETGADTVLRGQTIEDFDPSEDHLVIEPILNADTSSLTDVTIEEATDSFDGIGTEITLHYDLVNGTRDVVIWLPGATGMSLGDISLIGDQAAGLA